MLLVKPTHEILTLIDGEAIFKNIERAGRICYKSEDKITADSAKAFVARIIKSGHHSVIEHENISVKLICDRGVTHEIVRHRLCAYSQESTRYCNYSGGVTFVIPPWVNFKPGNYTQDVIGEINMEEQITHPDMLWLNFMDATEIRYINLLNKGWSPQQARSVLPNSLKTEIVMTANLREWRHIFNLRCSKAAHPQMREIMIPLRDALRQRIPIIFDE